MYRCVAHYHRCTIRRLTARSLQRRQLGCLLRTHGHMSGERRGHGLEGVQAVFGERWPITSQWPRSARVGIPLVRHPAGKGLSGLLCVRAKVHTESRSPAAILPSAAAEIEGSEDKWLPEVYGVGDKPRPVSYTTEAARRSVHPLRPSVHGRPNTTRAPDETATVWERAARMATG